MNSTRLCDDQSVVLRELIAFEQQKKAEAQKQQILQHQTNLQQIEILERQIKNHAKSKEFFLGLQHKIAEDINFRSTIPANFADLIMLLDLQGAE